MDKKKRFEKLHKLVDLLISSVHLVKHPANRKPILLIKSLKGGVDMPTDEELLELEDYEAELEDVLEDVEKEDLEGEDLGEAPDDRTLLSKALDAIQALGATEEDLTKAKKKKKKFNKKKAEKAAKGALRIIAKYNTTDAPKKFTKVVSALASYLGYGKPKTVKSEDMDEDIEKAKGGGAGALVNTVKSFLKTAKKSWDKLPKSVQNKVDNLAEAVGYEKYPEVKKSAYAVKLEKAMDGQRERIEKMEQELADTRRSKRLAELEVVSKSVGGLSPEDLYNLETADEDLFEGIVEHMQAITKRADTAELFSEFGTSAPIEKGTATDRLDREAKELVEKGEHESYADAVAFLSDDPEFREVLPELYRND